MTDRDKLQIMHMIGTALGVALQTLLIMGYAGWIMWKYRKLVREDEKRMKK